MKVYRNGVELENAAVRFDKSGKPVSVKENAKTAGTWHPAEGYEFKQAKIESQKKTEPSTVKKTKSKK